MGVRPQESDRRQDGRIGKGEAPPGKRRGLGIERVNMRIVFQTPGFGPSEHDYRWGLVESTGQLNSTWSSPEAAFIEAADVLDVEVATLDLVRTGPDTFEVRSK